MIGLGLIEVWVNYLQSYGFVGFLSLLLDLLRTKVFFPGSRLIRFPISLRGRRWIAFGKNFSAGRGLRIEAFGSSTSATKLIRIGNNVRVNDYVHIGSACSIEIGDRVLIASKVFITDHNHGHYSGQGSHSDPRVPPFDRSLSSSPVIIEADVWLGEFVAVLPGVTIGKGSIIGAMSTVTKDVPPFCIAVGSPAKVIKRYSEATRHWEAV